MRRTREVHVVRMDEHGPMLVSVVNRLPTLIDPLVHRSVISPFRLQAELCAARPTLFRKSCEPILEGRRRRCSPAQNPQGGEWGLYRIGKQPIKRHLRTIRH
jgi:hypothetical protein